MSVNNRNHYQISTNKQNGTDELQWSDSSLLSEDTNHSYVTVLQILNDLIDKAVDAVLKKHKEKPLINNKINVNVVNTIIENIYSEISRNKFSNRLNETYLLDDEIKQLINEMKYPPKISNDDKKRNDEEGNQITKSLSKQYELERKTGLINLVRNSKLFLSKFILNENIKTSDIQTNNKPETFLNIIELDCIGDKDTPYMATSKMLSSSADNDNDRVQMPNDNLMDVIDLFSNPILDESKNANASSSVVEDLEKGSTKKLGKKKKKKVDFSWFKFFSFMKKHPKKNQISSSSGQDQ